MLDCEVVDSHHHLWDLNQPAGGPRYPWLQEDAGRLRVHGDDSGIRHDYLVEDLLRDAASIGLTASVHVDAGATDGWAEAQWLQRLADEHGFPHAIVAGTALDAPDVAMQVERLGTLANVRGVRHILNWHPDPGLTYVDRPDLMHDPAWLAGLAELERHGLSFDLQVYPSQLADAAKLAAAHPSLPVNLNHAGMPIDRDAESMSVWREGLRLLAGQENVRVKISGIGMTDQAWTVDSLRPIVLECIAAFGPDRAMFGSNFPVDSIYSTYAEWYAAYDEVTADFSAGERRLLFGATARTAYRI